MFCYLHFQMMQVFQPLNNQLAVLHVTHQPPGASIYGVLIGSAHYYLSKTDGINDCRQLDSHALLSRLRLDEICVLLTRFELVGKVV